ncbi:hypothetical protein RCO48_30525 [Peribacillus frigoritolerans]|nr:hypothetical protein [Peribacillus frigoritolerans]
MNGSKKALAGDKEYKDYYIFKKSKGGEPPDQLDFEIRRPCMGICSGT